MTEVVLPFPPTVPAIINVALMKLQTVTFALGVDFPKASAYKCYLRDTSGREE